MASAGLPASVNQAVMPSVLSKRTRMFVKVLDETQYCSSVASECIVFPVEMALLLQAICCSVTSHPLLVS